jgi:hypothetical protein
MAFLRHLVSGWNYFPFAFFGLLFPVLEFCRYRRPDKARSGLLGL